MKLTNKSRTSCYSYDGSSNLLNPILMSFYFLQIYYNAKLTAAAISLLEQVLLNHVSRYAFGNHNVL